jgi:hypothetical protein
MSSFPDDYRDNQPAEPAVLSGWAAVIAMATPGSPLPSAVGMTLAAHDVRLRRRYSAGLPAPSWEEQERSIRNLQKSAQRAERNRTLARRWAAAQRARGRALSVSPTVARERARLREARRTGAASALIVRARQRRPQRAATRTARPGKKRHRHRSSGGDTDSPGDLAGRHTVLAGAGAP